MHVGARARATSGVAAKNERGTSLCVVRRVKGAETELRRLRDPDVMSSLP